MKSTGIVRTIDSVGRFVIPMELRRKMNLVNAEDAIVDTEKGFMVLYINADRNKATGWEGYDYAVNLNGKGVISKNVGNTWSWENAGEDHFEGMYFGILKQMLDIADEEEKSRILLAAKLSRQILDGQEVVLP